MIEVKTYATAFKSPPPPFVNITITPAASQRKVNNRMRNAIKAAAQASLKELKALANHNGQLHFLDANDPASKLSAFSAPTEDYENNTKLAYASLFTAKKLKST